MQWPNHNQCKWTQDSDIQWPGQDTSPSQFFPQPKNIHLNGWVQANFGGNQQIWDTGL